MVRKMQYQEKLIERKEIVSYETIHCDKCGVEVSTDPEEDIENFANDLRIYLNPDECVNFGHGRDYCTTCVRAIWEAMCGLIGADPDSENKDSLPGY